MSAAERMGGAFIGLPEKTPSYRIRNRVDSIRHGEVSSDMQSRDPGITATVSTRFGVNFVEWTKLPVNRQAVEDPLARPKIQGDGVSDSSLVRVRMDKGGYIVSNNKVIIFPVAEFYGDGNDRTILANFAADKPTFIVCPASDVREIIGHEGDFYLNPDLVQPPVDPTSAEQI